MQECFFKLGPFLQENRIDGYDAFILGVIYSRDKVKLEEVRLPIIIFSVQEC